MKISTSLFFTALTFCMCVPATASGSAPTDVRARIMAGHRAATGLKAHLRTPQRVDGEAPNVITDTPQGSQSVYSRTGNSLLNIFGSIVPTVQDGSAMEMVTDADGKTVYIKDIMSQRQLGSWVRGTREGNVISIPTGQAVSWDEDYQDGMYLGAGKFYEYEEDGMKYKSYEYDESVTEIKFIIGDDGTLTLEDHFRTLLETPKNVVALFYFSDNYWSSDADWNTVCTPFNEKPVDLPADVELSDWIFNYTSYSESTNRVIKAGIKDNKLYLSGVIGRPGENAVVGEIKGDKVVFAPNQFIGIEDGFICYFNSAVMETFEDPDFGPTTDYMVNGADYEMNFDAAAMSLTSPENTAIVVTIGKQSAGEAGVPYLAADNPRFYNFVERAAIPATPLITDFLDIYDTDGYNIVYATVPCEDVDGNYILPEHIFYTYYVKNGDDVKPFVFRADEYPGVASTGKNEITEVPYDLESESEKAYGYFDIMKGGDQVLFYTAAPDAIGLQTIYYGCGERRESEINWYALSGIDSIVNDGNNDAPVEYYDLAGRRIIKPAAGQLLIRRQGSAVSKVMF